MLSLACLVRLLICMKWDFVVGLLICFLCVDAAFFGAVVFVLRPVAGLLGRAAAFRGLVCFSKAAALFVVCGCHFLSLRSWILFRACHWPAWSAVFVKLDFLIF